MLEIFRIMLPTVFLASGNASVLHLGSMTCVPISKARLPVGGKVGFQCSPAMIASSPLALR